MNTAGRRSSSLIVHPSSFRNGGQPVGVRTGAEYLAGLRDGRTVWLGGERVEDVTAHPSLARTAGTIAALYDLQHDAALSEEMTFCSPVSGTRVALSYLIPET